MSLPPPSVNKDGHETDRSLLKRMGVRRENPSSGDQDQAQVQALYSSDMPVSEPVWWGIPCKFSFWVFQLWIEGIMTTGYWIVELWSVWLMFCQEALTPNIYPCVISFEGGESLAIFYFALSMLELEEDFDDMKHPSRLSSLPKPYTQVICPCLNP